MQHKDQRLEQLIRFIKTNCKIITASDLTGWTEKEIEEYEQKKILLFRGFSDEIRCNQCHKNCTIPVKIVEYPDDKQKGVYICRDQEHGGRLEFELSELKYWEISKAKLIELGYYKEPKKALTGGARRKRKKPKKKVVSSFKEWDKGEACFVHHAGQIKFYYQNEVKIIPFQEGSQAPIALTAFLGQSTRPGKEIKNLVGSNQAPSQVVKNINHTINDHLNKLWPEEDISNIKFIAYKEEYSAYELLPKIVEMDDLKRAIDIKT